MNIPLGESGFCFQLVTEINVVVLNGLKHKHAAVCCSVVWLESTRAQAGIGRLLPTGKKHSIWGEGRTSDCSLWPDSRSDFCNKWHRQRRSIPEYKLDGLLVHLWVLTGEDRLNIKSPFPLYLELSGTVECLSILLRVWSFFLHWIDAKASDIVWILSLDLAWPSARISSNGPPL